MSRKKSKERKMNPAMAKVNRVANKMQRQKDLDGLLEILEGWDAPNMKDEDAAPILHDVVAAARGESSSQSNEIMFGPEDTHEQLIERLLDFFDVSYKAMEPPTVFVTARGERLPIGLRLFANYKRERIEAHVTKGGIVCEGHVYDHPSGAAVEVKIRRGLSVKSAQSNGWLFWRYENASNRGVVLETLLRKAV